MRLNKIAPAASQQSVPGGHTTNNALWETWADDELTLPGPPDLAHPPQWPSNAVNVPSTLNATGWPAPAPPAPGAAPAPVAPKRLHPPLKQSIARELRAQTAQLPITILRRIPAPQPPAVTVGGSEEVRRNFQAFHFLITNNLWYTQGLRGAFNAGNAIQFPQEAIEVKANWVPIQEADKPNYHWNYDSNGNLFGLVAMHIITKTVPNWSWVTFEWVNNAGRCDHIGCYDTFGYTPSVIPPAQQNGGQYPPGTITSALNTLLTNAGLPAEFRNYRLKGSQVDFTDPTGRPTLLGNSVTEDGFVSSSSCLTCHARAAVDSTGTPTPNAGFASTNPLISPNGTPNPNWFWTNANPPTMTYLQIDFIWGIIQASPAPGIP